jgi:hypothetical protein
MARARINGVSIRPAQLRSSQRRLSSYTSPNVRVGRSRMVAASARRCRVRDMMLISYQLDTLFFGQTLNCVSKYIFQPYKYNPWNKQDDQRNQADNFPIFADLIARYHWFISSMSKSRRQGWDFPDSQKATRNCLYRPNHRPMSCALQTVCVQHHSRCT